MAYIENIPVDIKNNYYLFEINKNYLWTKFQQASKMSKRSMGIFFINVDLASLQKQLRYKNVNKIQTLLTELLYGKVR